MINSIDWVAFGDSPALGVETYYDLATRLAIQPESATDVDVKALATFFVRVWKAGDGNDMWMSPELARVFCVPVGSW